jgi:hypothetical protein
VDDDTRVQDGQRQELSSGDLRHGMHMAIFGEFSSDDRRSIAVTIVVVRPAAPVWVNMLSTLRQGLLQDPQAGGHDCHACDDAHYGEMFFTKGPGNWHELVQGDEDHDASHDRQHQPQERGIQEGQQQNRSYSCALLRLPVAA